MYLSTPEEGGGTRFNDLDIVMPARKGDAVLWHSTTDADPTRDEPCALFRLFNYSTTRL